MKTSSLTSPEPPAALNPFVQSPAVEKLGTELWQNVAGRDRCFSAIGGFVLMKVATSLTARRGWLPRVIGAILLARGLSGHCPFYYYLGKDTRHYGERR